MLITDDFAWDYSTFESYVEGLCPQISAYPSDIIPFFAPTTALTVLTLFAIWKVGKIAFPLDPKKPITTPLFTPTLPIPQTPTLKVWQPDHIATHLYTSGSSGTPKIACHTFQNHILSAQGSYRKIPLTETSLWALSIPLYHVGGLAILFRCYLSGARILISKNWTRATHLSLVPTQLFRLLQGNISLPNLQFLLLGGAPLPNLQTPWPVLPTYGMTEMSSQIVTNHTLHPHAEMKIAPDNEIFVRGGVLFQGYLNSGLPLTDGWFATGDLGSWHNDRFQILGRKDNLFISGGENIQPEEIEESLRIHCHIFDAIVVPLPDPEFGARPAVFLPDPSLLPYLQTQLLSVLPKFKIPIQAFPLPPNLGLKPSRKMLIESCAQTNNCKNCVHTK